jgi:hypothetical protein
MLIWPKDRVLWNRADQTKAVARRFPDGPPVLWLRTGNGTTRDLLHLLEPIWPTIDARLIAGERLVEIR